uniref:Regulator of G protein signaling 22 n=1 Tax=Scleropages formosus TaxID=113540 RepID=A0A8C9RFJ9_SCLFO
MSILSQQAFSTPLKYSKDCEVFELVSETAESISKRIRSLLSQYKLKPAASQTMISISTLPDNRCTVLCLDREQGIEWIKKERLPLFLQSDCYFEYRLAKLLSQVDGTHLGHSLLVDLKYQPWAVSPQCHPPAPVDDQGDALMTTLCESFGQVSRVACGVVQNPDNLGGCRFMPRSRSDRCELGYDWEVPAGPREGREHTQQRDSNEAFEMGEDIEESYHDNKVYNLEEFKRTLHGTPGEKLFYLWIDIERLKTLQNVKRKNRLLLQMKDHYLLSGGPCTLSVEMLSRLNIASTLCWREDKLCRVQAYITEVMLLYWCPRFWMVHSPSGEGGAARLRLWREQQLQLLMGIDPYTRAIRLLQQQRSRSCVPWGVPSAGWQVDQLLNHTRSSKRSDQDFIALPTGSTDEGAAGGGSRDWGDDTERMLQVLAQESRAGFFFTCFCEHSGNKLWESCIHFWCDLQLFHQLFGDDGLDLFRQQRQAQLLYYTYLCPSTHMSIGVEEECRRHVHAGLTSPHKELFEQAEQHAVAVLREPWSLLMAQDELTFSSVCHIAFTLPQGPCVCCTALMFNQYVCVCGSSTDLMCWLEIGQLRRIPQRDEAQRAQQSESIRSKYLNRKYFFGLNSPATRKEQEEVLQKVGGWGQLLRGYLSAPVLTHVQNLVRRRIENKWLPLYLATPQFSERQRMQDEFILRQRKKREMWKVGLTLGCGIQVSKELPEFCRALLNPVTCLEFRRFVSLKGDFLENGVLFWLEVQKYKDLHQSHSDEATIQQKVNTIISCFINSSIPPALQIDIPSEQARRILEQKRELGPYVFQEAQMTVLGDLFKLWPEFTAFKNSVEEQTQVLPLLDKHKAEQREQLKRQREEEKERRAKVRAGSAGEHTRTHLYEEWCLSCLSWVPS